MRLPYSGKVWRINSLANRLLIVSTNLDGFGKSWTIHQIHQTFPCQTYTLYGNNQIHTHTITLLHYINTTHVHTYQGESLYLMLVLQEQYQLCDNDNIFRSHKLYTNP